jgi:chromosome segregation ATPase
VLKGKEPEERAELEAIFAEEQKRIQESIGKKDKVRDELQAKLEEALVSQRTLQSELEAAEKQLSATRGITDDFRSFVSLAQSELEEERRFVANAQRECAKLDNIRNSAELSRREMEARLAVVDQNLQKVHKELKKDSNWQVVGLEEQVEEEQKHQDELLKKHEQLLEAKRDLEDDLQQALSMQDTLRKHAAAAETEYFSTLAADNDNRARAEVAERELENNHKNFQEALQRTQEAQRAQGALQVEMEAVASNIQAAEAAASQQQREMRQRLQDNDSLERIQAEREKEQQRLQDAKKQCSALSQERDSALERVREAERAKGELEAKLASAAGGAAPVGVGSPDALDSDERVLRLQAALDAEKANQAQLLAKYNELADVDDSEEHGERTLQAEVQLAKEQGQLKHALERLQETETAKAALVTRLASLDRELHDSQDALGKVADDRVLALQKALKEEQHRRTELMDQCDSLGVAKSELEGQIEAMEQSKAALRAESHQQAELEKQLQSANTSEDALKEQLAKADEELQRVKAVSEGANTRAIAMQTELSEEQRSKEAALRANDDLRKTLAVAEQELKAREELAQGDVESCIARLQAALADEHQHVAKIKRATRGFEKKIGEQPKKQDELRNKLSKTEAELIAEKSKAPTTSSTQVSKVAEELAEERKRMSDEMNAARQVENAKEDVKGKLADMEQKQKDRSSAMATVQKNLKEREAMLAKGSALAQRLAAVEQNLKKREAVSSAEMNKNIASLQAQIAKEQQQQAQVLGQDKARKSLEEELREADSRKVALEQELTAAQKQIKDNKDSASKNRALTAKAQAEREQARSIAEQARKEQIEISKGRLTAEQAKDSLQKKLVAMEDKIREQESKKQLEGIPFDKSATTQTAAEIPAQKVKPAPPPLREAHISFASDLGLRPESSQTGSPSMAGRAAAVGVQKVEPQAQMPVWAHVAGKLFNNLDKLGTGYVDSTQVTQLWPVLSRHVDAAAGAAGIAAKILQSIKPMNNSEWMSLMTALSSIVGPKRLRHNIHSAQAYLAEMQSGNVGANAAGAQGPAVQPQRQHKSMHRYGGSTDSSMKAIKADTRPL